MKQTVLSLLRSMCSYYVTESLLVFLNVHFTLLIMDYRGGFRKKIKGSSFVGVAATPLKPLPSCYRVKQKGD